MFRMRRQTLKVVLVTSLAWCLVVLIVLSFKDSELKSLGAVSNNAGNAHQSPQKLVGGKQVPPLDVFTLFTRDA